MAAGPPHQHLRLHTQYWTVSASRPNIELIRVCIINKCTITHIHILDDWAHRGALFPDPRSPMHFDGSVAPLCQRIAVDFGGLCRYHCDTLQNTACVCVFYFLPCVFVGTWARVRVRSKKRSMFAPARAHRLMTVASVCARTSEYLCDSAAHKISVFVCRVCVHIYTSYTLPGAYDERTCVRASQATCERAF